MAIHNFRQLRELELKVVRPNSNHKVLLSSVTSTELRKVIFQYGDDWGTMARHMGRWTSIIEKQLRELADRLRAIGYRHTLEVELRLMGVGGDQGEYDFTEFLRGFREKGDVVITDATHGDRVVHHSARNG